MTIVSKQWQRLFPQHGPGYKHQHRIVLAQWQRELVDRHHPLLLRGLIHSDGCRVIARERQAGRVRHAPRYLFVNLSEDIIRLFCASCDALGITWTRPNRKTIAVYRLSSVARIDEFVGPKS